MASGAFRRTAGSTSGRENAEAREPNYTARQVFMITVRPETDTLRCRRPQSAWAEIDHSQFGNTVDVSASVVVTRHYELEVLHRLAVFDVGD